MMIPLLVATLTGFVFLFGDLGRMDFMVQQMMAGIRPASLIAVPMFILAADIMTRGQSANRLIDMVMKFIGHVKGGLAVSSVTACTLFGAVSGSTQATVVAVGSPLRAAHAEGGLQGLLHHGADYQRLGHRLPDPALDRHDHLWRDSQHLDFGTVHCRASVPDCC